MTKATKINTLMCTYCEKYALIIVHVASEGIRIKKSNTFNTYIIYTTS